MTVHVFLFQDGESPGERMARCALETGTPGTMGYAVDPARYQAFLEVWQRAHMLRGVKTSCAVVASAVKGWCGGKLTRPWKADGTWGITSWLNLSFRHPSWTWAQDAEPEVGAIFYRDYNRKTTGMGHVGILVSQHDGGLWTTFEGGQWLDPKKDKAIVDSLSASDLKKTNGTVSRLSREPKDIRAKDAMNRLLIGWWRPSLMGLSDTMPPTFGAKNAA